VASEYIAPPDAFVVDVSIDPIENVPEALKVCIVYPPDDVTIPPDAF